jgi:hypothetical protein
MKKSLLFIFSILLGVSLLAQPVARDKVVIEIGTATW